MLQIVRGRPQLQRKVLPLVFIRTQRRFHYSKELCSFPRKTATRRVRKVDTNRLPMSRFMSIIGLGRAAIVGCPACQQEWPSGVLSAITFVVMDVDLLNTSVELPRCMCWIFIAGECVK